MHQNLPQTQTTNSLIQNYYQEQNESLNLSWKTVQCRTILEARDWRKLKQINLRNCQLDVSNVDMLVNMDWPNLDILYISENKIQSQAAQKLIHNDWSHLKELHVDSNFLQDEGFDILLSCHAIGKLVKLCVDKNNICWKGMSRMPEFVAPNLTILTLNYNKIGSKGIQLLIKSDLPVLAKLELYKCQIQAAGAKHLNKSKWDNIKHVNINDNYLVGEGHSILSINNWGKLSFISIWEPNPIHILSFVANSWSKGLSIDKDVYQPVFKKTINKILKCRFLK